jgi:anti-anti-sigma factor
VQTPSVHELRELLLEQMDRGGHTLLMCVSRYIEDKKVLEALIKAGAQVEARDANGMTALMHAARYNGSAEMCETLLAHGAAVNAVDNSGQSVLDHSRCNQYARVIGEILKHAGGRTGPNQKELSVYQSESINEFGSGGSTIKASLDIAGLQEALDRISTEGLDVKTRETKNGWLVFYLKGWIDTYNVGPLHKKIYLAIDNGYVRICVDCKELSYIASFDLFIGPLKKVQTLGGDLVLANLQKMIRQIYDLLGMAQLFRIVDGTSVIEKL